MNNLQVLALVFIATLVCNALGAIYQRLVMKESNLKAATVSVVMAGLSLLIWRHCLIETDLTSGVAVIATYLSADGLLFTSLENKFHIYWFFLLNPGIIL